MTHDLAVETLKKFYVAGQWASGDYRAFCDNIPLLRGLEHSGLLRVSARRWQVTAAGRIWYKLEGIVAKLGVREGTFLSLYRDILLSEDFADLDQTDLRDAAYALDQPHCQLARVVCVNTGHDQSTTRIIATDTDPIRLNWWSQQT